MQESFLVFLYMTVTIISLILHPPGNCDRAQRRDFTVQEKYNAKHLLLFDAMPFVQNNISKLDRKKCLNCQKLFKVESATQKKIPSTVRNKINVVFTVILTSNSVLSPIESPLCH